MQSAFVDAMSLRSFSYPASNEIVGLFALFRNGYSYVLSNIICVPYPPGQTAAAWACAKVVGVGA